MEKELKLKVTADTSKALQSYEALMKKFESTSGQSFSNLTNGIHKNGEALINSYKKVNESIKNGHSKVMNDITQKEVSEINKRVTESVNGSKKITEAIRNQSSRNESKFTGQSTILGSVDAINQQIKYQKQLRDTFATTTPEVQKYNHLIEHLTNTKKILTGQTKLSTLQFAEFGENLVTIGAGIYIFVQAAFQAGQQLASFVFSSINLGAELNVLKDSFAGTEADLQLFKKAVAGTVGEAGLIKLSNQASDLGVSLKDQALLFSLAEDVADKYGGTVEENFQKVIFAADGTSKGLRAVGVSVGAFNEEVRQLTKTLGVNFDALDAEAKMNIRLQAIYNLTGTSIDSVNKKVQDQKDKIDALKVKAQELVTIFGQTLVKSISETAGRLETMGKATEVLKTKVGFLEAASTSLAVVLSKFNAISIGAFIFDKVRIGIENTKTEVRDLLNLMSKIPGFGGLEQKGADNGIINAPGATFGGLRLAESESREGFGHAKEVLAEELKLSSAKQSGNKATKEQKDLVAELIRQQETLIGLAKVGETFDTASLQNALTQLKLSDALVQNDEQRLALKNEIEKVEKQLINNLKITSEPFSFGRSSIEQISKQTESQRIFEAVNGKFDKPDTPEQLRQKLLDGLSEAESKFLSIVNVFGLNMDTVLGRTLTTFQDILALIQGFLDTSKTVSSIIGIIGSFFTGGGSLASGAGLAGLSRGGTTFNNAAPILTAGFRQTAAREVPYILSTKISGKNLQLVLNRSNALENSRINR